jgi:hypothetical protein
MRHLLFAGSILLFLGCSEDPVRPPAPVSTPADIEVDGEWTILFETGVEWRLSIRQDSLCIEGFVQPDPRWKLYMIIEGEIEKGSPEFRFEGRSWYYLHVFQCRVRGTGVFEGGMELFDIETFEPITEFTFTATRHAGGNEQPPLLLKRSLPSRPREEDRRFPLFVPSAPAHP